MHIKTLFIDAIIGLLDDCYIFMVLSNKYLLNTKCTRKEDILSDVFFLYNNNTIKLRWFKWEEGTFGYLFFVEFA